MADTTSVDTAVTYTDAANATLGGYYRRITGSTTGTEAGDHAAMVARIVANEQASWSDAYTAPYINAFIGGCFAAA